MNRGDLLSSDYGKASRREAIFEDDEDRQRLLETLTEACEKTDWQGSERWRCQGGGWRTYPPGPSAANG